jgi:hypothetical protein
VDGRGRDVEADAAALDIYERFWHHARAGLEKGATPMGGAGFRVIGFLIGGAALLAVIGSFLPWAEALGGLLQKNGTDGDGVITLILALIGGGLSLAVALGRKRNTAIWTGLGACACGVMIAAVAAYDLNDLNHIIEETEREDLLFDPGLSAGTGLYVTLVAGIGMALISIVAVLTARDKAVTVEQ